MDIRDPGTVDWSALLPARTGVDVDALPWEEMFDADGNRTGVMLKWVIDPAIGKNCMLLRLPPNHRAAPHWHTSDCLYLVTQGDDARTVFVKRDENGHSSHEHNGHGADGDPGDDDDLED